MRRSTSALLAALAISSTACVAPQAMRSAHFSSFGDVSAASTSSASAPAVAPTVLRRSSRRAASIVKFVRSHRAQLEYCRNLERQANPAFAGTATVEVTLHENGYVLRARVLDRSWNADGASIEDCMLTAIRRWDFPDSGPLDEYVHAFSVTLGDGEARIEAPRQR